MARRNIEATFKSIAPSRLRGVPYPTTIGGGFVAGGSGTSSSMSQASNEIMQLRTAYQQQAQLIAANTQALQSNTSVQSNGHSVGSTLGGLASTFLGGGLGLLSPIVSGIASLFGGGPSAPPPLNYYVPPPPIALNGFMQPQSTGTMQTAAQPGNGSAAAPQVTVHVQAMDSQSFMDRANDIASAVREAMLNLHPINHVISSL